MKSKNLTCKFCSKTFSRRQNLTSHLLTHSGIKPYPCPECPKRFIRRQELILHKNSHLGIKPFRCFHCPKTFSQPAHLKAHVRTHTGEKPYQCPQCPKRFTQSSHLQSHRLHHTGEKPYKCPHCPSSFRLSSTLKCHLRRHTGEKPYKCHLCPMTFAQTTPLYHHLQKHTGHLPFRCRHCSKSFVTKKSCEDHQSMVCGGTGRRSQKCVFCGMRLYTELALERHLRLHIEEKPYFCNFCDLCFISWKAKRYHLRIHLNEGGRDKAYQCLLCHHRFEDKERWDRHMKQNHLEERRLEGLEGVREQKGVLECDKCSKTFDTREELRDHNIESHLVRRMMGEVEWRRRRWREKMEEMRRRRPFVCGRCGVRFSAGIELALHGKLVHEGVTAWKCGGCWKSFPTEGRLKGHVEGEHGGMEVKKEIQMEGYRCSANYGRALLF